MPLPFGMFSSYLHRSSVNQLRNKHVLASKRRFSYREINGVMGYFASELLRPLHHHANLLWESSRAGMPSSLILPVTLSTIFPTTLSVGTVIRILPIFRRICTANSTLSSAVELSKKAGTHSTTGSIPRGAS